MTLNEARKRIEDNCPCIPVKVFKDLKELSGKMLEDAWMGAHACGDAKGEVVRAEAELADAKNDPTSMGTSLFKDRRAALKYYSKYGFHTPDVDEKIKNKEISIGSLPAAANGRWDEDERWHVIGAPGLERIATRVTDVRDHWHKLVRGNERYFEAARIVQRIAAGEVMMPARNIRSATALRSTLSSCKDTPWEEKAPYNHHGRPIYSADDFALEYAKPRNNRRFRFMWKGSKYEFIVLRMFHQSTDIAWGMGYDKPQLFVAVGALVHPVNSMTAAMLVVTGS